MRELCKFRQAPNPTSLAMPPRLESVGLGDGYRMMVRRLAREGMMREPFDYAAEAARLEREGIEVFTSRQRAR